MTKIQIVVDKDRQVIPRWRSFQLTTQSGQLLPYVKSDKKIIDKNVISKKYDEWKLNQNIAIASDLACAAFIADETAIENEVLNYLDKHQQRPNLLKDSYREIISSDNEDTLVINAAKFKAVEELVKLRYRLRQYPRDPISWTDLSFYHTLLGNREKAVRAIEIALGLDPNNRFILRAAARLYIHLDMPDKAHAVLTRSVISRRDPWVLSAEIAVAQAAKISSGNIIRARKILESKNIEACHISELASAVATLEFVNGKHKKARNIFALSLEMPTENSIAQVGWANRRDSLIRLPEDKLEVSDSYEARAWYFYEKQEWERTIDETMNWLNDQPFSSRPALIGSYVATLALDDHKKSLEFCKKGLSCNQFDIYLLNNAAVACSYLGDCKKAKEFIGKINFTELNDAEKIMCFATKGLIAYKGGDFNQGRELYRKSIELALKTKNISSMFSASLHFAYEEAMHNQNYAKEIVSNVLKNKNVQIEPVILPFLRKINNRIKFIDDVSCLLSSKDYKKKLT